VFALLIMSKINKYLAICVMLNEIRANIVPT
jgi:hypothetical protein